MIDKLIQDLNREHAVELGTALKFAADVLVGQSNRGAARLIVRDLQRDLDASALRNGWRNAEDTPIHGPLSECLGELDLASLNLLMTTLAVVARRWPMSPNVAAVIDELRLEVEAGRIAGGHVLDYDAEREIEKLLGGDQAA